MRLPSSFFFLVSFLFLFYHSTLIVHSKVLCLDNEKHALLDFKLSFVDPSDFLSSWSFDSVDCCTNWVGVDCDPDTGHVTSLYLEGMESNKLRPSLLELQHLTSLALRGNDFTMRIPKFISSLGNLTHLDLSLSGFVGEIPSHLGNLSKLQSLDLSSSGLSGEIPPQLGYLSKLQSLDLSRSGLSGEIPPQLGYLSKLQSLDLSSSGLSGEIPPQLGYLSKLQSLDLSSSRLSGEIPLQLGNLSKLQSLDLSDSDGLYADNLHWLSRLSSLASLNFIGLNLTNAVDWVSTLKMLPTLSEFKCKSCSLPPPILSSNIHVNFSTSLQTLDLSNNSVSSSTFSYLVNGLQRVSLDNMKSQTNLPEFLESLIAKARYSLEELSVAGNDLNSLPLELISMFPSLTSLDVSSNKISASLPEILRYLQSNLTSLDLSSNLLYGVIFDAHLSKFHVLEELVLSNNNFLKFRFSKRWVPPFQLFSLDLSSCEVGPSFPNWILTQTYLKEVDLSNSLISGAIPHAFWNRNVFESFNLNFSHNQISGMVPNSPVPCDIISIDLSYNAFHGPIPPFLFGADILLLSNNKFSSFPLNYPQMSLDSPSAYSSLIIDLSKNNISGTLPKWLFQFEELLILNLENNKLSGNLPEAIGSLTQLRALHLSNNIFSRQLPSSMKNCTLLTTLELAKNKFSGVVPSWLGENMENLVALNLRSNYFSEGLVSSLCNLQSLQILDLSENRLSGTIPSCLYNFSSMTVKNGSSFSKKKAYYSSDHQLALDFASLMWKGALVELYAQNLDQRNVIDLSGNLLSGEIPIGVTTLKELRSLDLSRNNLTGSIPNKIGQMTSLEVLKLSSNRLSGEIPESLAALNFLGTLNLSNNNLSGRIPTGTQLQSFYVSSYAGNPKLCGQPLPTKCPGDEDDGQKQPLSGKDAHEEDDESFDIQAFLATLGMGFAVGFLGVLGVLHFNRQWRLAYFQLVNNVADKIFVTTSLIKASTDTTM